MPLCFLVFHTIYQQPKTIFLTVGAHIVMDCWFWNSHLYKLVFPPWLYTLSNGILPIVLRSS